MPRESLSCNEAQSALAEIKSLKTEFERVLEDAIQTGELERARTLRSGLESRVRELREILISPVERKLDVKHQYESQRRILESADILQRLPSGEQGIRGAYPMPSYQEIRDLIREKKDVLEKKAEQGFTKLLIVPFGMKLDDLVEKYKELLLKHKAEEKLFATKEKDSDPDVFLDLDTNEPVYRWSEYRGADQNGKLIYDPKEFSLKSKRKGKENNKSQILIHDTLTAERAPRLPTRSVGTLLFKPACRLSRYQYASGTRSEAGKYPPVLYVILPLP